MTAGRRRVFLSVGRPHDAAQAAFLMKLEASLRARRMEPWTLGRSDYDYRNPLRAIRSSMMECHGAVIVGLERSYSPILFERRGSPDQRRITHVASSTPWNQLEAGMAYQLELPLLILKERALRAEGILDPAIGDYFVTEFDIDVESRGLSKALKAVIHRWGTTSTRPISVIRPQTSTLRGSSWPKRSSSH